ncbi:MAG TPA: transglycosylase SLT domain-containing protein [Longimicrobium sp.]|nr:transglycosylase SLT domain-containing protein [Longimicrobium sp.]
MQSLILKLQADLAARKPRVFHVSPLLRQLQEDVAARKRRRWNVAGLARTMVVGGTLFLAAYLVGARQGSGQLLAAGWPSMLRPTSAEGMVELQKAEIARLKRIHAYSTRFGIPADLAERIEDIALAEGIDPDLAFGLVRAESEFNRRAVSPVGAVGLTQLMPGTAKYYKRGVTRADLFDRDTNLRIGFRYLKSLIEKYDGNLELALLAYNRGPERVDQLVRAGQDPNNGYVQAVLGKKGRKNN